MIGTLKNSLPRMKNCKSVQELCHALSETVSAINSCLLMEPDDEIITPAHCMLERSIQFSQCQMSAVLKRSTRSKPIERSANKKPTHQIMAPPKFGVQTLALQGLNIGVSAKSADLIAICKLATL